MTNPSTLPFALTRPQDIEDPYPIYRRYRDADPIHIIPAAPPGNTDSVYLFRYDDVAHVLASQHYGRSAQFAATGAIGPPALIPAQFPALREVVDNWLVFLDPPRHT